MYNYSGLIEAIVALFTTFATVFTGFTGLKSLRKKSSDVEDFKNILGDLRFDKGKHGEIENKKAIDHEKYALFLQYHSQGLSQSKISFWFSLIFASIGFAIIVTGILSIQGNSNILSQGKPFISMLSGTIIDAVAGLFFVQSNRARQLMIDFFDKLRADRKFDESLNLADQIPDNHLKSKLKILLSLNFADIKISDDVLNLILNSIEGRQRKDSDQR